MNTVEKHLLANLEQRASQLLALVYSGATSVDEITATVGPLADRSVLEITRVAPGLRRARHPIWRLLPPWGLGSYKPSLRDGVLLGITTFEERYQRPPTTPEDHESIAAFAVAWTLAGAMSWG